MRDEDDDLFSSSGFGFPNGDESRSAVSSSAFLIFISLLKVRMIPETFTDLFGKLVSTVNGNMSLKASFCNPEASSLMRESDLGIGSSVFLDRLVESDRDRDIPLVTDTAGIDSCLFTQQQHQSLSPLNRFLYPLL